jgi:hypothetical protein
MKFTIYYRGKVEPVFKWFEKCTLYDNIVTSYFLNTTGVYNNENQWVIYQYSLGEYSWLKISISNEQLATLFQMTFYENLHSN